MGLSPHRILFLRDRASRALPWMDHGNVAKEATAMMPEANDTAKKVCDAMVAEDAKRAGYFCSGDFTSIGLRTLCGSGGATRTSCPGTGSIHGTYRVSYCEGPGRMSM